MGFISIVILDILAIGLFFFLAVGLLLGIIGLIILIKNQIDKNNGKEISAVRKVVCVVFCVLGVLALIVIIGIGCFYFLKIK